jgi:exoribonuclease R
MIGILELTNKYKYGITSHGAPMYLFTPYDTTAPPLIVGCSTRDTSHNQIAQVNRAPDDTQQQSQPLARGHLVQLLGPVGDRIAEERGLLLHLCPITKHPSIPSIPSTTENRTELSATTGWTVITVDPPGCKDADDAIGFHPTTGCWTISIADVDAHVPVGSPMDHTASQIGSTFYGLTGVVRMSMLPPSVSEDGASLICGLRRKAVTLFVPRDGPSYFGLTWITVGHAFTYDTFVKPVDYPEVAGTFDPHVWIEDWMLLYNKQVGRLLKENGVGILRTQPPTDVEKARALSVIDPRLAFEPGTYESVQEHLPQQHSSIGSVYCHASSPLRRYVDLVNQRILKQLLLGSVDTSISMDKLVDHLNLRAKANKRWTRDLTFLTHVVPGRVSVVDVIWIDSTHVWVPSWSKRIRLRHEETHEAGFKGRIQVFCDPTKRCWKERVLTAIC